MDEDIEVSGAIPLERWRALGESLMASQRMEAGALYMVATPIGNRADISLRALMTLERMDVIACEDTRTSGALLMAYGIRKRLMSAHRHNEHEAADQIVSLLRQGQRVAYLSDAGTPGVSDPGATLANAVLGAGLPVIPIPGASALTGLLSVAGLSEGPVAFLGFLPNKEGQLKAALSEWSSVNAHLVFYEAPHRIAATMAAVHEVLGERRIVIGRELTKRFESIAVMQSGDVVAFLGQDPDRLRGEFVVAVERRDEPADPLAQAMPALVALLDAGLSVSRAAEVCAVVTGAPRKSLYRAALAHQAKPETP